MRWLIGIILGEIICESSNWQHIQRLKSTILGANWQLFRLERIAKCSYFILSTQNIKFYWFVMKIKKFLLLIWWYNRGSFPLGNKYVWVFILNGLMQFECIDKHILSGISDYFRLFLTHALTPLCSSRHILYSFVSVTLSSHFPTLDQTALMVRCQSGTSSTTLVSAVAKFMPGTVCRNNSALPWQKEASDIPSKSELLMFLYFT